MGKKRIEIALGSFSSGPDGTVAVDQSVLSMNGSHASASLDRMFAVIDGPDDVISQVHAGLVRAFEIGGPADLLVRGAEENYLDSVLDRVTLDVTSHWNLAIAVAVQTEEQIILATLGGAEAGICRANGTLDSVPEDAVERTQGARIWRTHLEPGDSVVLGGRQVNAHVNHSEMRQTVQAGFSVEHASQWLTTLASTRSQKIATALVARVQPDDVRPRRPAMGSPSRLPRLSLARPARGVLALAGFSGLALIFVIILGMVFPGQNGAAAEPAAPNALQSYPQPHSVLLSWQDSSAGASAYVVIVGGVRHTVHTPFIKLDNQLIPGRLYQWRVKSRFTGGRVLTSKQAVVYVPTAPALAAPTILSPGSVAFPASQAANVKFCWTAPRAYTSFSLWLSGANKHYNSQLSRRSLVETEKGQLCVSRALPPAAFYAWRLGASGAGYTPASTTWHHFSIAAVPTPTPTPVPVTSVPVYTPAPAYNTGYNTAPSTGYNTAPSTGYNTAPNTGYNSGTTSSPPAPVPTTPPTGDQSCPHPPNCS